MADLTVSSSVDSMMQASSASGIRDAIGAVNYPYTTDFISGTERTRNLTSIETNSGYTFDSNLTSIYIGSNVTTIGSYAFYYCSGLTSANIPDSVTSLAEAAFASTAITSINIPDSVTSIGNSVFYGTLLTSVDIPDSVTSIGSSAFSYSTSITSVNIGKGVTTIGNYAFGGALSLATINCLATTAPTLGSNAFNNVVATQIHVPVGATGYGTTYGGLTVVADL